LLLGIIFKDVNSGGNGAAMRVQRHVWCAGKGKPISEILKGVIRNAITTHGHSRAIIGATFHAMCLREATVGIKIPGPSDWHSILENLKLIPDLIHSDEELVLYWLPNLEKETGHKVEDAIYQSISELREDIRAAETILNITEGYDRLDASYAQLARRIRCLQDSDVGSAPKTALLAAYLSHVFKDHPHDALTEAVNLIGTDTDTISTMAGAIMGTMATTDPPESVIDKDYLENESRRLS
jgi:ADP-ribosylglycohydrolase